MFLQGILSDMLSDNACLPLNLDILGTLPGGRYSLVKIMQLKYAYTCEASWHS